MKHFDEYYKQLEGATILEYQGVVDYGSLKQSPSPAFLIKLSDGEIVHVSLASGNDPFEGGAILGLKIVE